MFLISPGCCRSWTGFGLRSLKVKSFTKKRLLAVPAKAVGRGIPITCAHYLRTKGKMDLRASSLPWLWYASWIWTKNPAHTQGDQSNHSGNQNTFVTDQIESGDTTQCSLYLWYLSKIACTSVKNFSFCSQDCNTEATKQLFLWLIHCF